MCVIESQSRVLNLQTNGNSKNKRHGRAQSTDVHSLATDKIFCIHKHLVFRDIALLIYLLFTAFLIFYNRSSLFKQKKILGFNLKTQQFPKDESILNSCMGVQIRVSLYSRISYLCAGLSLPWENVGHLLIWDLFLLAQTHGLTQAGSQEVLTLENTDTQNSSIMWHLIMLKTELRVAWK